MPLKKFIKDLPIYKELYDSLKNKSLTEKDLKQLPELSKKEISKNFPDNWMTSQLKKAIDEENYEFMTTSGTTSERTQIIRPKNWWLGEDQRIYNHINSEFPQYERMTSKAILTTAICSNTMCYKETPPYEKRIVNGILHLNYTDNPNKWSKNDIKRMIDEINKFKPQCIQADPIYLSLFFKQIKQNKLKLPEWKPHLLILTYEFVPKKCKTFIKQFWNIPTTILYGCTEFGGLFYQNNKEKIQIIDDLTFCNYISFKNKKSIYKLLITSFRNPFMPLINYNSNDLLSCEINSNNQIIIKQFMGRIQDTTISNDNNILTLGELDNYLSELENNILIYTLDFTIPNKLFFKYLTFDDLPLLSLLNLKEKIEQLYGENHSIEFIHERSINPAPSGKFEIIKKEK